MTSRTTRVAPPILAALVAIMTSGAPLRADPADTPDAPATPATTVAKADNCLLKPNAPSPAGSHWYYHVDRLSGRRCWFLRQQEAGAGQKSEKPEHVNRVQRATPRAQTAPADAPVADTSTATLHDAGGAQTSAPAVQPSAAPPSAPSAIASPSAPADWPSTPLASAPAPTQVDRDQVNTDNDAAAPAPLPSADSAVDPHQSGPVADSAQPLPAQAPKIERRGESGMDMSHLPALLATALALACIIFGSFALRLAARMLGARRRHVVRDAPTVDWDGEYAEAQLVPEITTMPPGRAARVRPRVRNSTPPMQLLARAAHPPRETAQMLEANVRGLLRRLRMDLAAKPGDAASAEPGDAAAAESAAPPPPPYVSDVQAPSLALGDLEAALALWRGNRSETPVRRGQSRG